MIRGGIEKKIKIVTVNRNIFDIQTANEFEIESVFADSKYKEDFFYIAKKLQGIPFLYNTVDINLSDTIMLRNLLNIPSVYPIVSKKKEGNLYTRAPRRINIVVGDEIYAVPEEQQLFVLGLLIDVTKQGLFYTNTEKASHIIPEYLDTFQTKGQYKVVLFHDDVKQVLLNLTKQIRYASRYYNSMSMTLHVQEQYRLFMESIDVNKNTTTKPFLESFVVMKWYSEDCIKNIKLLINDSSDWTYNLSPLQSLGNDIDQLLYSETEGMDSEKIKQYLTFKNINQNKLINLLQYEQKQLKKVNLAKRYLIIVENKLGSSIYRRILLNASKGKYLRLPGGSMAIPSLLSNVIDPKSILGLLTKDQQSIVKVEYEKQESHYNAYKNNKCSHVKLYRSLIRSKNINQKETYLKSLTDYFNTELINGHHMCKECKFSILCDHTYTKISNEISNLPITAINANLYKYTIKIRVNDSNVYYCKFCGEQLLKDIALDDSDIKHKKNYMSEQDMDVRSFIWSVVINIVKTTNVGNERAVISYIANTIRPFILISNFDNFDNTVKLKIVTHCYAYILKIIKEQKIPFFGINHELPTNKIAEELLSIMADKYKILIKELRINTQTVKNEFISAYKNISHLNVIPISNTELELANFIININPIYHYAKLICVLFKKIPSTNFDVNKLTSQQLKKEFEIIMGTDIPSIIKISKNNTKNAEYVNVINNRLGNALPVQDLDYFYRIPELSTYLNIIKIDNEKKIIKDFINGKYENYLYVSYILFYMYINDLHSNDDYVEFRKLLLEVKQIEDLIRVKVNRPVYYILSENNSHFIKQDILLTRQYDENGNKHKWNIWWYGNQSFNKPPSNKETTLTDIQCSVCKVKLSEINKLDLVKTTNSVNAMADLNAFYIFYKIRCPISDLHNWLSDKCTKCSLTINMIDEVIANKINQDTLDYYNRFLDQFKNIKREVIIEEEKIINNLIIEKFDFNWNYTVIVKTSQLFNIEINWLLSIGLSENRTVKEIIEGIDIPKIELFNIYSAYSELLYVLSSCSTIVKLEYNYAGAFEYLLYNQSYDLTHKFIIQSICEVLLLVGTDGESILKTVINHQKAICKPVSTSGIVDDTEDIGVYIGDDVVDIIDEDITIMQRKKTSTNYNVLYKNIDFDYLEYKDSNNAFRSSPDEYIYWPN